MKLSKFNTAVNYDEGIIYHNSFTNRFLLLDPFLYDLIKSIREKQDFDTLKEVHEDFYNALTEFGFILEDEVDELQKMRDLIDTIDNQDQYYHLIINPTMNCNFSCWYCYEKHEKKSQISDETIDKILRMIENIFIANPQMKAIVLSFFGGEPLLFYNKMSILMAKAKQITDRYNKRLEIAITSNGLLINDDMIADLKQYNVAGFQITLDGNKSKHDLVRFVSKSRGSYDAIIDNIKKLARNQLVVTLRINYTKENLVDLEEVIDDLDELSMDDKRWISLSMQKVFQETNSKDLADMVVNFREYATSKGIIHRSSVLADTVRNSCYADKVHQSVINYNADVYKCNARDFNQANKEGVLNEKGEIIWNEQHNKRLIPKMTNKPCLECSILPICGGGCSQMIVENVGRDYCVHNFDEESKKEVILNMFIDEQTKAV
ncbi:radical SAM/SPASM domain-containing protein [Empedobacter brevis NBRC 14943 = ATCC 43319]|uniref:Radical SAM/SPASM domain-containing protein n=2 Tax=Empedobacter brevis TaxID=247 RepID=A0A511ND31_9FLAO|nr:radical SAM protein [Empedobacter brevis]GEM50724.1 radical SAM/SPASM domain-containing protein [Empedobacter brevis NBRC 14943 = ATCC 43319]